MIRLSAKSRYAVSALMHLALHNQAGAVPLAEVSVCQGISLSYLDQIFTRLRRTGMVRGCPGPGGGYRLGRAPREITIGEVIELMEGGRGRRPAVSALDSAVWAGLAKRLEGFLQRLTLEDFVHRPAIRERALAQYRGGRWRCGVCGALANRRPGDSGI